VVLQTTIRRHALRTQPSSQRRPSPGQPRLHRPDRHWFASDFVSDIRVLIAPHPVGSSGPEQEGGDDPTRSPTRSSRTPSQGVPQPNREVRAVAAAGDRGTEPERGGRAVRDRPVDGDADPPGGQAGRAGGAGGLQAGGAAGPRGRRAGRGPGGDTAAGRGGQGAGDRADAAAGKSRWG
jgi:hypothetical protein